MYYIEDVVEEGGLVDFSHAPEQHFDKDFIQEAFSCLAVDGSALSDNKTLMDQAEAENIERFKDNSEGIDFNRAPEQHLNNQFVQEAAFGGYQSKKATSNQPSVPC